MSNISASGLRHLHQLHLELSEITEKLERGPKRIEARRQYAKRKHAELEACRQQLLELRKSADAKNLQLKTNENKIAKLRVKLNAASSNREYDIIRSQIDADTMANSVLEDEILEILDKIDQLKVRCGKLEQEWQEAVADEKRLTEEVTAEEPELRRRVEGLEAEIAEAEKMIPAEIAEDYRRLVHAHGPTALAPAVNDACSECYFSLSPQSRVELNSGKIVFCKNCGRLLYRPDEPASA